MISQRGRRFSRRQILSPWVWDVLHCAGTVIIMGSILAVLFIEFPNGIRSLRDVHVGIVSGQRTITLNP